MTTDTDIIEAAIFVFAYKPDATMDDVADKAGVTRITINRKFGSKAQLLDKAQLYSVKQFEDILKRARTSRKSAMNKILMVLQEYYRFRNHYFFWMRSMVDDPSGNQKHFLKQLEYMEKMVRDAQEQGDIRQDLPAGWVASFFDLLIVTSSMSRHRGVIAERDMLKIAWDTFQSGVSPIGTYKKGPL